MSHLHDVSTLADRGPRSMAPCGCTIAPDPASGVLRSVRKCRAHERQRRDPATLGEAYYRELGALDADAPARYVAELVEALGPLPPARGDFDEALEVGCGASPYAEFLRLAGYLYHGCDPSPWAAEWSVLCYGVDCVATRPFEDLPEPSPPIINLILAAHVFEHLADAPAGIAKAARLLAPSGELWVIVPDDSDLMNPDHYWHFTEATLRRTIEASGLTVDRMAVRRRIKRESFLYARARKPD